MKKNNDLKRFVLTGILLFSGYFGFAQTAIIRIISEKTYDGIKCYELEYKKSSEGDTAWVKIEVTPQDVAVNNKFHTLYTLTNLECGTEYDVRVHICLRNGIAGRWSSINFTTPEPYTGGSWSWEIGPFDVTCHEVMERSTALSLPDPNVEEIWASEERDIAKEAIKEE